MGPPQAAPFVAGSRQSDTPGAEMTMARLLTEDLMVAR
jgi:hypothetical protein